MKFAIHTQYMENYGAHSESGTFKDGNAFWKMKGGNTYIVSGLSRYQDAIAYVVTEYSEVGAVHIKEFVTSWETEDEWHSGMVDDSLEYQEFLKGDVTLCHVMSDKEHWLNREANRAAQGER